MQLAALDSAQAIDDMNIPGFRLHPLKGEEKRSLVDLGEWQLATDV
jgi:proteic killer suppression protein